MSSRMPNTCHAASAPAATLAGRAREILAALAEQVRADLADILEHVPETLEHTLFEAAGNARSSQLQADIYAESRALHRQGARFSRQFLDALLPALLELQPVPDEGADGRPAPGQTDTFTLTLVEDQDVDQAIVLHDIARKLLAAQLDVLQLLAQRFGVLAGSAALEVERLPLAPLALTRVLRAVGQTLRISLPTQLQLYRVFEHQLAPGYGRLLERANHLLDQAGILPGLVYHPHLSRPSPPRHGRRPQPVPTPPGEVPLGAREAAQRPMTTWSSDAAAGRSWAQAMLAELMPAPFAPATAASANAPVGTASTSPMPARSAPHGHDGGPGVVAAGAAASPSAEGAGTVSTAPAPATPTSPMPLLQGLLQRARAQAAQAGVDMSTPPPAAALPAPAAEVNDLLGRMQAQPPAGQDIAGLRQTLLDALCQRHGRAVALPPHEADTFDLLGLLFSSLVREMRSDSPARPLLDRLQVPVLRAALADPDFFVRDRHPARELLNAVAEAGARWTDEDETDPHTLIRLQKTVQHVVKDYDGDEAVLASANREIRDHVQAQARKAEVAERRHVEAARGKERLDLARHTAHTCVERGMAGHTVPRFVQSLLRQAWADVLTLTLLRHGEASPQWHQRSELTRRSIEVTTRGKVADPDLGARIEEALLQVGYHGDEAGAIARRLSTPGGEDEASSRTELMARLKARARLGERQAEAARKPEPPARTPAEQAAYEQLRVLPFGTWFEFTINQQGDLRRRRLSWYSLMTDNALFVNQRGQKVAEMTLDALSRLMVRRQARIVTEERARLIDRAWQATLRMLRSLAGRPGATEEIPA